MEVGGNYGGMVWIMGGELLNDRIREFGVKRRRKRRMVGWGMMLESGVLGVEENVGIFRG